MKANHLIASMSLFFIFGIFALVMHYGWASEAAMMIVGALIVWGGQIVTFYFRKKPKE